jgi:glycosyltransferase involved in cell wall biosynthesis
MRLVDLASAPLGGLPEVVEDGVTGYLVTPGDARELLERIAPLRSDRRHAAQLGANRRERAFERFSRAACAEHYFYADLTRPR